jgi:hypothetical protein
MVQIRISTAATLVLALLQAAGAQHLTLIDVGPYASFSADNDTTFITNNAYFNGTNWIYKNSNLAGRYRQQQGFHVWDTAASGTAGGTLTFSERMRIDASGNVGIGTSSPSALLDLVGGAASPGTSSTPTNITGCQLREDGKAEVAALKGASRKT